jgi:hypothetical protein
MELLNENNVLFEKTKQLQYPGSRTDSCQKH